MSLRPSTCGPRRRPARATCRPACPSTWPSIVMVTSPASRLARPKSITCGRPSASSMMFEGLTSRWTTPRPVGVLQGVGDLGDQGGSLPVTGRRTVKKVGQGDALDERR